VGDVYHEPRELVRPETIERHRAIRSIIEELDAVDWYDQRVDATEDPELRAILAHNRDEEKEHAAMALEWLRRRDPALDGHLREYLFSQGSITGRESAAEAEGQASGGGPGDGSLGLGGLRRTS
jgi:ferritin-like protein